MNERKRAFTKGLAQLSAAAKNAGRTGAAARSASMSTPPGLCGSLGAVIPDQLLQGDCIQLLNDGPGGWVDLAFADPPFNIGYLYDGYEDRRKCEDYLSFSREWMKAIHRALKPAGSFYLAIGDDYAADLCVIARRELGFTLRNWLIWHYTFGQQPTKKFAKSHTHILYFVKDEQQFTFNADAVRVPSARQMIYADSRANPRGKLPDDVWVLRPPEAPEPLFARECDTWNVSRVCGTFKERQGWHGCQMPMEVLNRIIAVSSNRGDVVLDPFNGSGTTTTAAAILGRKYVGIDQSEHYVKFARDRLARALAKAPAHNKAGDEPAASYKILPRARRVVTPTDSLGRPRVTRARKRSA